MVLFSQNNASKRHLPYSQVHTVTYNPCRVTSMSFLQVSVFSGRYLGGYFQNQVANTKLLVAMAPKVVASWRVALCKGTLVLIPLGKCRFLHAVFNVIDGHRYLSADCRIFSVGLKIINVSPK